MAVTTPIRTFEHLVLDFLAYLEIERGLSRNTLEAYRSDLLQYGAWLTEHDLDALAAGHAELSSFVAALASGRNGRPAASTTRAAQGRLPALLLPPPAPRGAARHRPDDRTARPRSAPSACRRSCPATRSATCSTSRAATSPPALRDRAMLELMYACGLRASEVIGLELRDLDLEDGVMKARGKGSKERIVPVGSKACAAVAAWLEHGRPKLVGVGEEDRIFVNHRGGGLSRQGLYKIVQRHARTAGFDDRMSPHTLRHTFATPSAGRRLRPALGAGDARPRRHRHHADLHPPDGRPAARRLLRRAPARRRPARLTRGSLAQSAACPAAPS